MEMQSIKPRESILLAENFETLVAWYREALGFKVTSIFEDGFHFANLATDSGIRIGIGSAKEMGVEPGNRANATVLLQIEAEDVRFLSTWRVLAAWPTCQPRTTNRMTFGSVDSPTPKGTPGGSSTKTAHEERPERLHLSQPHLQRPPCCD